jgi:hypothetical protein
MIFCLYSFSPSTCSMVCNASIKQVYAICDVQSRRCASSLCESNKIGQLWANAVAYSCTKTIVMIARNRPTLDMPFVFC